MPSLTPALPALMNEPLVRAALLEDLGRAGDITTDALILDGQMAEAVIASRQPGCVSGVTVAALAFRLLAPEMQVEIVRPDGSRVEPGDGVMRIAGSGRAMLSAERTALNFLARLSGVATLTARFVTAAGGARVLDTRKTTPGLRYLEKYAVTCGGGENHRYALYDAVLVKENHLAFGGDLAGALERRPEGMPAIVEAESVEEFHRAAAAGADVVMVDEFTPEQVREVAALQNRPLLEVSGGVTLDSIRAYADAGIDRISIGALTHSAPALDLSMRVERT